MMITHCLGGDIDTVRVDEYISSSSQKLLVKYINDYIVSSYELMW